ncbi:MAG: hypothetical protein ABIQ18_06645 [Umezawaea sp.]
MLVLSITGTAHSRVEVLLSRLYSCGVPPTTSMCPVASPVPPAESAYLIAMT